MADYDFKAFFIKPSGLNPNIFKWNKSAVLYSVTVRCPPIEIANSLSTLSKAMEPLLNFLYLDLPKIASAVTVRQCGLGRIAVMSMSKYFLRKNFRKRAYYCYTTLVFVKIQGKNKSGKANALHQAAVDIIKVYLSLDGRVNCGSHSFLFSEINLWLGRGLTKVR